MAKGVAESVREQARVIANEIHAAYLEDRAHDGSVVYGPMREQWIADKLEPLLAAQAEAEERIACCHRILQDVHAVGDPDGPLEARIETELNGDCPHTCGTCETSRDAAWQVADALAEALKTAREYLRATEGSMPIHPNVVTPDRKKCDAALSLHSEAKR